MVYVWDEGLNCNGVEYSQLFAESTAGGKLGLFSIIESNTRLKD